MPDGLFVLWQFHRGQWSRATGPVPHAEAVRMRDAATASGKSVLYRVLPAHLTPDDTP